jgi:hypothetical protein
MAGDGKTANLFLRCGGEFVTFERQAELIREIKEIPPGQELNHEIKRSGNENMGGGGRE